MVRENIVLKQFQDETQMPKIMSMIGKDLSEPYSIFTYRYFILGWPDLCIIAHRDSTILGVVICKVDERKCEKSTYLRGYIGSLLVEYAIRRMAHRGCEEVVLETEISNKAALRLYENLGFTRDKRLEKYYLNGGDAFRLKLKIDDSKIPIDETF